MGSKAILNVATTEGSAFPEPQYPLPEEIRKLDKDDTVCQYCGISYFILHEIKQLKAELMTAKNEISDLKAYRSMYEELLAKWQSNENSKDINQSLVKEKDAQIASLEKQIKSLKNDNERVAALSNSLECSEKRVAILSSSYADVFRHLRALKSQASSLKASLLASKSLMETFVGSQLAKVEHEVRNVYSTYEKQHQEALSDQKRTLNEKFRLREAEWQVLEIKLREADAQSASELVKIKAQLLSMSELSNSKNTETSRLERENNDMKRQIEALKNSITALEQNLTLENQRYMDMRNIIDQKSQDNQTLDACIQRLKAELETNRSALLEQESLLRKEKEEMNERFALQLKSLEAQLQLDIEKVQSQQKERFEAGEERIRQALRRESDARMAAMQESFVNERNRFESKMSKLAAELESYQRTNEEMTKLKEVAEQKASELETKLRKLESILRQVHEEKLAESNRAAQAENEVNVLQSIVERECEERARITEALNAVKRDIIKAKLPCDVMGELMEKVPDSVSNILVGQKNSQLRNSLNVNEGNARMRAWSFDSQSASNSTVISAVDETIEKQRSADEPNRKPQMNNSNGRTDNAKTKRQPEIASHLSPSALAAIVEKRRQMMMTQNGAYTLPPLANAPQLPQNGLHSDGTSITSVGSSPLGLYQRNHTNSTLVSDVGDNSKPPPVPYRLNPMGNHAPIRQSMSESNLGHQSRPPPGKVPPAQDMRLKINAILSRK